MSNKNTQGYSNMNLSTLKQEAVNGLKAFASEIITISGIVQRLSASKLELDPKAIHVYVRSNITTLALTYTYDGTTATSGTGFGRFNNDEFILTEFANLQKFQVIEENVGTTTIFITYLK